MMGLILTFHLLLQVLLNGRVPNSFENIYASLLEIYRRSCGLAVQQAPMIVLVSAFYTKSPEHRHARAEPSRRLHDRPRRAVVVNDGHPVLAHMPNCSVDAVLVRESFDASLSPARGAMGVFVQEMLPAGQPLVVEQGATLEMPTSLTKPSSDVLDLHPLVFPSPQDAKVRTWGRTYQPVGIVILAYASRQFAMLLKIEVPTSSLRVSSGEVECLEP